MSVDILMATYNGERFIAEQLDSLLAQTYTDWHLLVSDDCSSDATVDILREYASRDSRIKIVSSGVRRGGARDNFWSLMPYAEAPYIMFCDQDDVWHPNKIEVSLGAIKHMEEAYGTNIPFLVFTDLSIVNADLDLVSDSFMRHEGYYPTRLDFERLLFANIAPGCTMLFNKALADEASAYDIHDFIDIHDWWLMIVASATGHIRYIDEPTIDYRQHDRNAIGIVKHTGFNPPSTKNALNKAILTRKRVAVLLENSSTSIHGDIVGRMADYRNSGQGGIKGLYLLTKSGFWDKSLRKRLGQIYATLFRLGRSH